MTHNISNVNTNFKLDKTWWTLFFDGSKSQQGAWVGCVLINLEGNKTMIVCHLEFECTNIMVEYEALIQGHNKAIDLKAKVTKAFGDSKIIVR